MRNGQGEERAVAELGAGEVIGEIAVVTGEKRTATVVAIRDTQIATLTKPAFDRLVLRHPAWAVRTISHKLAQRLIDSAALAQRAELGRIPRRQFESLLALTERVNGSRVVTRDQFLGLFDNSLFWTVASLPDRSGRHRL